MLSYWFPSHLQLEGTKRKKKRAVLNTIGGGTSEVGVVKVARSKVLRPNFFHTLSGKEQFKKRSISGYDGRRCNQKRRV
jgi:hypothetical protein